ncbi:hypothetical protein DFH29DRAFT_814521 [Suillus ampliporus]|nr:hypothetical protein DFH29DRAFT_814521 [Suillus ampliporus]
MVGDSRYKIHLAEAQDMAQRLDCDNHQVVNQANVSHHKLEATGIGRCAWVRHGCFVPHSMVDFQKGERQMNMDYALCQALGTSVFYMLRSFGEAPTRKQQELHLLDCQVQSPASEIHRGAATWLASGITLEEAQVGLLIDMKKLEKWSTDTQKLTIGQCCDRLQGQLDEFVRVAVTFLGNEFDNYDQLDGMTIMLDAAAFYSVGSSSDDPDWSDEDEDYDLPVEFNPKTMVISLPSNIGIERCAKWGVADLVLQEILLREGQENDALHAIRINLANKAMLFRTTVWPAKSQAWSTRGWARVHLVDKILHLNTQIYSKCHKQLIHLGTNDLLTKYQPLEKANLKATMVVVDLNVHGQRNSTLAWFLSIDVQGDSTNNDWMNECGHFTDLPIPLQC